MRFLAFLLFFGSNVALAQNSPCYWSGQLVKCFPTTGLYLDSGRALRLGDATTNYVEFKAANAVTTYSLTWPAAQGASSQTLSNNGSGALSWVTPNPGTVTNVTGTPPIQVATGTTTPAVSITQSGVATDGYLSSADWVTFNNKVSSTRAINTTAPLQGGGDLSADRTFSMTQASTTTDGYLSSTDWNTFNGKQAAGNYVTALTGDVVATGPGSVAATIQPLSVTNAKIANTTIDLTAKVTGTLPVGNGGTNSNAALSSNRVMESVAGAIVEAPAITANSAIISSASGLPVTGGATATEVSYLSGVTSAIQTQLNGKVPTTRSVNTTSPLTGGGALSADLTIAIPVATSLVNGYLSSADWSTFNGKQAAGNYITALTGDVTAAGPGSAAATIAALAVTNSKIANATIDLTAKVTGTLPVANGGTGTTTSTGSGNTVLSTTPALASPVVSNYEDLTEIATPASPGAGVLRVYSKSGDGIYIKNSGGTESQLSTTSLATPTSSGIVTTYFPTIQSGVNNVSSASYTVTTTDGYESILVSTGASTRTVTLPACSSNAGRRLIVKKTDSGAGTVSVARAGADTIDGATSYVLSNQYDAVGIYCDGTATWNVLSYNSPDRLMRSTLRSTASPSLTSGAGANITTNSLDLTPGSWLICAGAGLKPNATAAVTQINFALSKTSATLPAADTSMVPTSGEILLEDDINSTAPGSGSDFARSLPCYRFSPTTNTSLFLVATASFTGAAATLTAYGFMEASKLTN